MNDGRDETLEPAQTPGGPSEAAPTGQPAGDLPPGPRDQVGFADLPPPPGWVGSAPAIPSGIGPPPPPAPPPPPPPPVAVAAGGGDADVPSGEAEGARMGLLDHLEELRKVLIQSLVAIGIGAGLCWFWSAQLMEIVIAPVSVQGVYFTAPNDAFMARLKVAVVIGLFAVAPFVLYRVYAFVLPALYRKERRVMGPILFWTALLFYLGVAFAFFVVAPYVMTFMMGFGTETLKPLINVSSYLGFVFRLCLGFGLVFELPMVILGVCIAGIVRPQVLLRTWRYAIVIIAIISAIFTPPDVISQVMMMVPVLVLYLGSALLALILVRKRDKARAAAEAAEAAAEGD